MQDDSSISQEAALRLRPDSHPPRPKLGESLPLFLLALFNYGLMYAANITLAHRLRAEAFDDYSVAVSTVAMLSTFATLGLEKYALRAVALFRDRQDWSAYRGYWLFSLFVISGLSLTLLVLVGIALEIAYALYGASDLHIPIILLSCYLPFIAVSLFLVEILAAHGAFLIGVCVYRLVLPATYLLLIFIALNDTANASAENAALCLGTAWILAFAILWLAFQSIAPPSAQHAVPEFRIAKWLKRSIPLVLNSLMMSVMTSGGVVIMQFIHTEKLEVGVYAVAAQTGAFISLIGTSTNRYFLPMIVVAIEHRDFAELRIILQRKALIVGGLILALLAIISYYGETILLLFGKNFSQGGLTLGIIASGASFSAFFADVPYYLQFIGHPRLVLKFTLSAVLSMWALSALLGPEHGPIGVATAYAVPVIVLFFGLRIVAEIQLKRMQYSGRQVS